MAQPISLEAALLVGENDHIEFKQELKDRQTLLKAITAFANTNGGTIFIGVVDGTMEVIGIDVEAPGRRDAFERGLRNSIQSNIQPPPAIAVDYERKNDRTVARVFVPAARDAHSFEGRYYVREGPQCRYVSNGEISRL